MIPIADPLFYLLAVPALLLTGISKGGFASGGGNLAVPAMSLVIAPPQAAGIVLPILCAMDVFGVWAYRRDWDRRTMTILAPGALIGIGLGALAFGELSDRAVKAMIGAIAVAFVLHAALRSRLVRASDAPAAEAPAKGLFWSALSGFTSTLAHAGGPPLAVYLLPRRLPRLRLNATTVVFFTLVNYVKLVPYALLGQLHGGNLATSAVLLPTAPAGVLLGIWLSRRISDRIFYRAVFALLLVTGLKLLHDGLAG
jgi:uncharacterized membrane protein YfcA